MLATGFFASIVAFGATFSLLFSLGIVGIVVSVVVATGLTTCSYLSAAHLALALTRPKPADPVLYARLYNLVDGLCIASGVPMPALYVVDDEALNAFSTGRDPRHASLVVTSGLAEALSRIELEAVVAHELSKIKNCDTMLSTLAVTMVGIFAMPADFGLRFLILGRRKGEDGAGMLVSVLSIAFIPLAPLMAALMRLTVPRRNESLADLAAVDMTRYPPGLIAALEKLRDEQTVVATANRATAHLWIEEPLDEISDAASKWSRLAHLFDTHPPIEQRIAALREL